MEDYGTPGPDPKTVRRILTVAGILAALSLVLVGLDYQIKRQVLEEAAELREEILHERERRAAAPKPRSQRRNVPAGSSDPAPDPGRAAGP